MASLERNMLIYIANNFNFDDYWVTQDAVHLLWVANGGVLGDLRFQLFISYYQLTPGYVEVIPEEPIAVYFVDAEMYLALLAWMIENGTDCPRGGDIVAFPEKGFSPCYPDEALRKA
jgi:hypothetical protein